MRFSTSNVLLYSLFHSAATAATVSCPSQATCNGLAGILVNALKDYPPAKSVCSSRVPVPRKTCTSTAPQVKATSTVSTVTVRLTVATTTTTVTTSTVTDSVTTTVTPLATTTNIMTVIDTATTTTIATVTRAAKRDVVIARGEARNARREKLAARQDARATQLSSLLKSAGAFVSSVCTCLQTPASTTVVTTPTTTVSATATATSSITAATTATVTPRTTVTVTSSAATSTITSSATTTVTVTTVTTTTTTVDPPAPTCNIANGPSIGSEGCSDGTTCNVPAIGCGFGSQCENICLSNPNCIAYTAANSDQTCYTYGECCS